MQGVYAADLFCLIRFDVIPHSKIDQVPMKKFATVKYWHKMIFYSTLWRDLKRKCFEQSGIFSWIA